MMNDLALPEIQDRGGLKVYVSAAGECITESQAEACEHGWPWMDRHTPQIIVVDKPCSEASLL